ncbi:M23 family metallopeptidase [Nocardia sp. NPDC050630]|uniref:M23 family metallopeptidase n=1 Tax=Nocardia sp. NPDC050630 TaxID=3364321 RepID=UPI0037AA677D
MNRLGRVGGIYHRRLISIVLGIIALLGLVAEQSVSAAPHEEFGWPMQPRPAVERQFDRPAQDWLPGHRGVDLAGTPGQAVFAAGAGIVVFAGRVAGKPVVSIDHPGGLRTTYEPVQAEVSVGLRVARGARIGTVEAGHEGCGAAACLHWGARRDESGHSRREYIDPLGLLHSTPLRLKPVT